MQRKRYILNSFIKTAMTLTIAVLIVCNLIFSVSVKAGEKATPEELMEDVIAFKVKDGNAPVKSVQEWIDKCLINQVGGSGEWYIIALKQMGSGDDFSAYRNELEKYVLSAPANNTTALKLSLTLMMLGAKDNAFIDKSINNAISTDNIMSLIYGLHLYNNGATEGEFSKQELIEKIISMRLKDGGWAIMGEESDVDVTAMVLQALIPSRDSLRTVVDESIELLAKKQLSSGGYESFGIENPESACQVIIALCAAGVNPLNDSRFIKDNKTLLDVLADYKVSTGGYTHVYGSDKADGTATVQVFMALDALHRLTHNRGSIYLVDDVPWENTGINEKIVGSSNSNLGELFKSKVNRIKIVIWIALAVAVAVLCVLFIILKKKNVKNYIFIVTVGLVLGVLVFFINISSVEDYYKKDIIKGEKIGEVTITIRCDTIVGIDDNKYIPEDGVVMPVASYDIDSNTSVYDILLEATKDNHIQVENTGFDGNVHGSVYIAGINYLYEQQYGMLSGWIYHVNGVAPSVGCGDYILKDKDEIEWLYTRELGHDLD